MTFDGLHYNRIIDSGLLPLAGCLIVWLVVVVIVLVVAVVAVVVAVVVMVVVVVVLELMETCYWAALWN